jgi:hypothetical protein
VIDLFNQPHLHLFPFSKKNLHLSCLSVCKLLPFRNEELTEEAP